MPSYEGYVDPAAEALKRRFAIIPSTATLRRSAVGGGGEVFPEGMRIGEDQWLWVRMMQRGSKFCFSQASLVRYSHSASNRSASIYRSECTRHSIEELYDASQSDTLNEYIARIGIGKALADSPRRRRGCAACGAGILLYASEPSAAATVEAARGATEMLQGPCRCSLPPGGVDRIATRIVTVCGYYGTGSYPLPPHGWQRSSRRTASHVPLIGPCLRNASSAYCEQVGVKRHEGGLRGDMPTW